MNTRLPEVWVPLLTGAASGFLHYHLISVVSGAIPFSIVCMWYERRPLLKLWDGNGAVPRPRTMHFYLTLIACFAAMSVVSATLACAAYFPAYWLHHISN